MDLNDKLVKAIYSNDDTKNKVVLEGSYAVYKVIMRDMPKDPEIHNRVIKISDLDVDLYDEIEKLWDEYGGASYALNEAVFKKFQELFSGVINSLNKEGVSAIFLEKIPKVTKRYGNNTITYGFEVVLKLGASNKNVGKNIIIDVNVVKSQIPQKIKSVNIDNTDINVIIYDNEKYFANKLIAFDKHFYYYNKSTKDGDKNNIVGNREKLWLDHFDIVFIQKYLYLDYYKIDEYLKLMGSALMYDDYVKLINEWVKGGKK